MSDYPHIAFLGPRPRSLSDIVAVVFDGDMLPLPAVTVKTLTEVLAHGFTVRIHARTATDLDRGCMAIGLATGLQGCWGEA